MKPLLPFISLFSALAVAQPTNSTQQKSPVGHLGNTDTIVVCVPHTYGWNMVSNPVFRTPGTDSIWQVFCNAERTCFPSWPPGGGYVQSCVAQNGRGFWVKVLPPGLTTCCIVGEAITHDTTDVVPGWNLIGTISYPVAASTIYSIPSNIISSGFIGFSTGYTRVDTLLPGLAYWVKARGSGRIVLSSGF